MLSTHFKRLWYIPKRQTVLLYPVLPRHVLVPSADSVPLARVLGLARNLGLDLHRSMAPRSKERLLGLAVILVQEFGLCSLLTVELDRDPEGMAAYIIAVSGCPLVPSNTR